MKTGVYTPTFFLARKGLTMKINSKTVIGRSGGTIILEDDDLLSSVHCEINPTLLEVTIKDLDSTNGVYVNRQKIFPNTDFKINVGDEVKIGRDTYILCDSDREAKKIDPPSDRRRYPRAKNLYSLENLINFYSAQVIFRFIYLLVFLAAIASTFLNMHLEIPIPEELSMLTKFYNEQVVFSGLKVIFIVYGLSLLHGLALHLYFNRDPIRKLFSLGVYFVLILYTVDFANGPLGAIRTYLTARQELMELDPSDKSIVKLKTLVRLKDNLARSYKSTKQKLEDPDKKVLEKDYKALDNQLMKRINKVRK